MRLLLKKTLKLKKFLRIQQENDYSAYKVSAVHVIMNQTDMLHENSAHDSFRVHPTQPRVNISLARPLFNYTKLFKALAGPPHGRTSSF